MLLNNFHEVRWVVNLYRWILSLPELLTFARCCSGL